MAATLDNASLEAFRRRLECRRDDLTSLIAQGRRADQPVSPDKAIGRLTRQDALQQQLGGPVNLTQIGPSPTSAVS